MNYSSQSKERRVHNCSIALDTNPAGNIEMVYSNPTKWVLPHRSLLPPAPKYILLCKVLLLLFIIIWLYKRLHIRTKLSLCFSRHFNPGQQSPDDSIVGRAGSQLRGVVIPKDRIAPSMNTY